jgi:hypothetical protein
MVLSGLNRAMTYHNFTHYDFCHSRHKCSFNRTMMLSIQQPSLPYKYRRNCYV